MNNEISQRREFRAAVRRAGLCAVLLAGSICFLGLCPEALAVTKFEQFSSDAEKAYQSKNYPEAQKNFEQALKEAEKLDKNDKRVPTTVYNLALVFQAQGNYAEAEKNMLKAMDMIKYVYGPEHQRVAQVYMDLGDLYLEQSGQENKPELRGKAAENYKKGTDMYEKIYSQLTAEGETESETDSEEGKGKKKGEKADKGDDKNQPKYGTQEAASDLFHALKLFGDFYAEDESYAQAEPLYKRSLELEEFVSGPEDKDLARHKAKLAEMYCVQGKLPKAEPLFQEATAALEKSDPGSLQLANVLYNFGGMYYDQGQFGEAEIRFKQAFKIFDKLEDQDQQDLAQKRIALAGALDRQGKAEEAESEYKNCIAVFEKGSDKSVLIRGLKAFQQHLLMANRKDEANKVASRIRSLRAEK